MKKMKKKKNEIFFFIFLPISKKKGIITLWPLWPGAGGGTKRPFRGFYQIVHFVFKNVNEVKS